MGRKVLMLLGVAGFGTIIAAAVPVSANSLNVNTAMPVRPHVHLNAPLHIDVKSRVPLELDLSEACRTDEQLKRVKPSKRDRRCRQQR